MPEGKDKEQKRPLDQFREDELWRKINAAHARKAAKNNQGVSELDRQLEKSSAELFAETESEAEPKDELSLLEEKDEKIRDFVHSLYRGDELQEQRAPGPLREPSIKPRDERSKTEEIGENFVPQESMDLDSLKAEEKEADTGKGIRKFRLGLQASLDLDLDLKTEYQSGEVDDLAAKFLAEEAEREASVREFEEMIKAAETGEFQVLDSLPPSQEDAFSNRMPEFTEDGTAKASAEARVIGSELLNQQALDFSQELEDLLDEEVEEEKLSSAEIGLRPVSLSTDKIDREEVEPEAAIEEVEQESEKHPLLELDESSGPSRIRGPKASPVEGSQNLIARKEGERRERAHQEFQESLSPLRQAAIDQTVQKLQSGALAPPFYVPRLPRQASSFNEALDFARRLHPLPREMQLMQQPSHRTWLLAQLNHCNTQERLSRFAFSLNHEDLALLFPTLASLKRGKHIERLLSIILMRASHYLYLQGWITLQFAYPRSTVEKGLSELCNVLDDSFFPSGPELGEAERAFLTRLNFSEEQFIWTQVRMISEIALPNQRHFLSKIVNYIKEEGQQPEEFYREFAIYPDLPLAKAIQSSWDMSILDAKTVSGGFSPRQLFD